MDGFNTSSVKNHKGILIVLILSLLSVAGTMFFSSNLKNKQTACESENVYETVAGGSSECVMEVTSGRILHQLSGDRKLPMASTTKIMTALCVIENTDINKKIKVPKEAVGVEGSSIYLVEGEILSIKELLYGLMLQSGNDAAETLAIVTSGSKEKFVSLMNETAEKLGLKNTHFTNPHGLHNEEHYTSANDLAAISCYAMQNAIFKEIVGTKFIKIPYKVGISEEPMYRYVKNKNKILTEYDGGTGIKTGYTKAAGRCLVSSAQRDGMEVVAVVLNHGGMFEDCKNLMSNAFEQYKMIKVAEKGKTMGLVGIYNGVREYAQIALNEDIYLPLKDSEVNTVKLECIKIDPLRAPLLKDTKVSQLNVFLDNRLLLSKNLYSIETINEKGVMDHFKDIVSKWSNLR